MEKNILNIALAVTAVIAIAALAVFFVKLDKLSGPAEPGKADTSVDKGEGAVLEKDPASNLSSIT